MQKDTPLIYISNWSSSRTPGHHGTSGRKFSVMVKTPDYVVPDGKVTALVPSEKDLWAARQGKITSEIYKQRYMKQLWDTLPSLKPGELFYTEHGAGEQLVQDGDTLCCVCSRRDSADDKCHRAWAAQVLKEAGWTVILDGKKLRDDVQPSQGALFSGV